MDRPSLAPGGGGAADSQGPPPAPGGGGAADSQGPPPAPGGGGAADSQGPPPAPGGGGAAASQGPRPAAGGGGAAASQGPRPAAGGGGAASQAVFAALSDPTRRAVLQAVATGEASTATELAAQLPISRQAVAKHLAQLREANLVDARRSGRETRFEATPAPLADAIGWMTDVGAQWDTRLAALGEAVKR